MRRSATEVIRNLEQRIARLENKSSSIKMVRNPIIVRIDDFSPEIQVFCPKSELRNIEGFGGMNNGKAYTDKGKLHPSSTNPMCGTRIVFSSDDDLNACLSSLSKTYTVIESA